MSKKDSLAKFKKAFAEGNIVEHQRTIGSPWLPLSSPTWKDSPHRYRIAESKVPKTKPLTLEAKYKKLKLAAQRVSDNYWKGEATTGRSYNGDHDALLATLKELK